jgi:glutathione S-transferase
MSAIYHIAIAADWAQAQRDGEYTISSRGRTLAEEGFIHASAAEWVAPVANLFYRGLPEVLVLVIDTDKVTAEIRYEPAPDLGASFPHIYGPLNLDAVVDIRPLAAGPDGQFSF